MEENANRWLEGIVTRMYELMHHVEVDNFDSYRYEPAMASAFLYQQHAAYLSFFFLNASSFYQARCLLSDDTSRSWFDHLILFRLLGHHHVRLPFNTPEHRDFQSITNKWRIGESSERSVLGPLYNFSVPVDGGPLRFTCWDGNLAAGLLWSQYFLYRDDIVVAPAVGDHVVDAGGCFGDTALIFGCTVGDAGHIYTFDPLKQHCKIMRSAFALNPGIASRIELFDCGLSDSDNPGARTNERDDVIDPGARVTVGGDLPTRTLDSLADEGRLPRVDFIKMDIEGSELMALKGAERTLRKWKPKLAISLYHRAEDFFSIPLWLNALGSGYRFFLDHYSIHHEETVLYATVQR
jgi:FkbM family methyltransferase